MPRHPSLFFRSFSRYGSRRAHPALTNRFSQPFSRLGNARTALSFACLRPTARSACAACRTYRAGPARTSRTRFARGTRPARNGPARRPIFRSDLIIVFSDQSIPKHLIIGNNFLPLFTKRPRSFHISLKSRLHLRILKRENLE